jgi:hypothetical protein
MTLKFIIILVIILKSALVQGQNKDTLVALKGGWEKATRSRPNEWPLIIINEREFEYCDFSNLFFDNSKIATVNVISPKNDSIRIFGKAGRNGIIIITTRDIITWVSSKEIIRHNSKSLFPSYKKYILRINGKFADPREEIYIQKDLIKSVNLEKDALEFYLNEEYHRVIEIKLTKEYYIQHNSVS